VNYPYFGVNNAMSVDTTKQGMYGQNAMVLPGSYGGDPYAVVGNSGVGLGGYGPQSIAGFQADMSPYRAISPGMNPYQGMTPFGNHYTRYLMGGGQRQNRLARPVRGDFAFGGGNPGKFGQPQFSGYRPALPAVQTPYDTIG